jgi:hypothetical protein
MHLHLRSEDVIEKSLAPQCAAEPTRGALNAYRRAGLEDSAGQAICLDGIVLGRGGPTKWAAMTKRPSDG